MEDEKIINEDNLARVHDLLACMKGGDEEGAKEIVDDLARVREGVLYQEMGKLTRELHDAISAFGMDDRITDIAAHDIPDARERLNFVIAKTDDAANKTLTAVEASIPICETMENQASELHNEWQRFKNREMDAAGFRALSKKLETYLHTNGTDVASIKGYLNEVLLAQDFQDLTGQIIKRVITLVEEVEGNLVDLIKLTGMPEDQARKTEEPELSGPAVPGIDDEKTVSGQDEVDDLLSSLGF
jgi:chemotaxis protein CheZ